MIPTLQSPAITKDAGHLDLAFRSLWMDPSTRPSVNSPDPSTVRNLLAGITNVNGLSSPPIVPVIGVSVDDLPSFLSRSLFAMRPSRMSTVDHHDTDAWTRERKVHGSEPNAVVVSTSLASKGTVLGDPFPVNVGTTSALMELQTERPRAVEKFSKAGQLCEEVVVHSHDWIYPAAPWFGVSHARCNVTVDPCQSGVIDVSGTSPTRPPAVGWGHDFGTHPDELPVTSCVTSELRCGENELLITALADWTSEWVHALVIQPYLQGKFHFQHQGEPNGASASVASRIRRVLDNVENPVQVAIHALWFVGTLAGRSARDDESFLSVPIFRYLHNNGTFLAEDFMFRTFVACTIISDKTVNDETLTTNTWNCLTRIPQVILNATEKYTLSCLKWSVVMTHTQWQDTIIYLRSRIKMSSVFDPFSYDGTSPSGVMARCLDELIALSDAGEAYSPQEEISAVEILSPQPIRHFTYWEVFNAADWCPKDDPMINQKLQTIGIAPSAAPNPRSLKAGTTAKDLLDSIIGPRNITNLTHLVQPAGTSFCGSLGVIGARLAHTIRIASACQSASWVSSHG